MKITWINGENKYREKVLVGIYNENEFFNIESKIIQIPQYTENGSKIVIEKMEYILISMENDCRNYVNRCFSLIEAKEYAEKYIETHSITMEKKTRKVLLNTITDGENQFYPTPAFLAGKMFSFLDPKRIGEVLEPSAGNGALLEVFEPFIERKVSRCQFNRNNIDTIEIDSQLQALLRGKGFRVIHSNFLEFETLKRYDTIIMNPPFAEGDKHLLKAISLLQEGGQVVCLLNAETLHNPYSNSRKLLQLKLNEYNAKIIFVADAFKKAARRTNVEVAIVYLSIPERKKNSTIFERLRLAQEYKTEQEETHSIVEAPKTWIDELILDFELNAKAGISLIEEYFALIPHLKNDESHYSRMIELKIGNTWSGSTKNEYINQLLCSMRELYWRKLLEHSELTSRMTSQMRSDYESKLSSLKDFDFSPFNVQTVFFDICQSLNQGVHDSIMDLFEKLTVEYSWFPETKKNIHYYNGWKTNKAHKIGKKVIIPLNGAFADSWRHELLDTYHISNVIRDLERALNFLDRGETVYRDPNFVGLQRANERGVSKDVDFTYFSCTFYKKGTCHITFRDNAQRIIDRLNIYASQNRNWLPPCYGKKQYNDMTAEEKAVIDDFQGQQAYEEIMKNPELYLTEISNTISLLN